MGVRFLAITVAGSLLLASCTKSDGTPDAGRAVARQAIAQSCNEIRSTGTCTEYPEGSSFTLAEGACKMVPGAGSVWGKDRCPTARLVGVCVDRSADALYKNETEYYYAPDFTVDTARAECHDGPPSSSKTFTAGTFRPSEGEVRGSCTHKTSAPDRASPDRPDRCEEYAYGSSVETFATIRARCSGEGDALELGAGCPEKERASARCDERDGAIAYFPTDAKAARDYCEVEPRKGRYTKLSVDTSSSGKARKADGGPAPRGSSIAK